MITHFYESIYDLHGDKAKVVDTEDAGGTIKGVKAVLTMQEQDAEPEAVYPVLAFLQAWVPEPEAPEADAGTPPEQRGDAEELSMEVEEEDQEFDLGPYIRVLRVLRGAELATATKSTRGVLVPWVAAALGEVW